jgi:hypothetical protein
MLTYDKYILRIVVYHVSKYSVLEAVNKNIPRKECNNDLFLSSLGSVTKTHTIVKLFNRWVWNIRTENQGYEQTKQLFTDMFNDEVQ